MKVVCALIVLSTVAALSATAHEDVRSDYAVIVHPDAPVDVIDRALLADVFLKKVTRWKDDSVIRPVDLEASSPVRRHFSEEVLDRSVSAVKSYWQSLIFSGRALPPPEFEIDAQVVSYVVRHPGAVGYVKRGTALQGARVLDIRQ